MSAPIGSRAVLWYVGDAGQTGALDTHPQAYAARVTALFEHGARRVLPLPARPG